MSESEWGGYFNTGDKVTHDVYGDGEIIACERPISKLYYRVEFNGHSMSVHHGQLELLKEN